VFDLSLAGDFYSAFLTKELPKATKRIWIATADIKNMHIKEGRKFVPFLSSLAKRLDEGLSIRLLHAKEPGPRFRKDFDRFPVFAKCDRFERALCPRVHMKVVIVDAHIAYIGSANLTGAGMGAKSENKRNFEAGVVTRDKKMIRDVEDYFDRIFTGEFCTKCLLRKVCPDPLDSI
jgi:phosphatidylserine/phosphatidylglycerophosphate/cardiolipin synthase-like enzyme